MDRFELLFKQALEQDCEILFVVAGWDVRLRIYADDGIWDLDAEDDEFSSFASTRLFVEKFNIIHIAKVIQAIGKRLAKSTPTSAMSARVEITTAVDMCAHYEFKNEEDRKAALNCRYCEKGFSHKDALDRHEKICPKNPEILRDPKLKAPPAPKRRYLKIEEVPSGSDNAPKAYGQLDAEDAKLLPRIDPADAVIYHHEKYCRYPGCEYPIRHDRIIKKDTKKKKTNTIFNEKRLQNTPSLL
ncbi:hypothetical protein N7474_004923 [Penicillium riverlandense]|uniref:uncharacterized protein n=1 Tax=Penicillium riverlandense TaxID=1903569 RepID=UPI002546A300|nr:uncharacterized protein N7474_004923 [Penicillium riverlandense]KAJ5819332.1 hypothetical protein N7474_004923 [Penicillium riverlandense]